MKRTIEISKDFFLKSLDVIETQWNKDNKCSEAFKQILPNDYISGYDNGRLYRLSIDLLKLLMNDENQWIDYFIWELDFGKKWTENSITENGNSIKLETNEELWFLLTNNQWKNPKHNQLILNLSNEFPEISFDVRSFGNGCIVKVFYKNKSDENAKFEYLCECYNDRAELIDFNRFYDICSKRLKWNLNN